MPGAAHRGHDPTQAGTMPGSMSLTALENRSVAHRDNVRKRCHRVAQAYAQGFTSVARRAERNTEPLAHLQIHDPVEGKTGDVGDEAITEQNLVAWRWPLAGSLLNSLRNASGSRTVRTSIPDDSNQAPTRPLRYPTVHARQANFEAGA